MTSWGNDYWVNHGLSSSTYALVVGGPSATPLLAGTPPRMSMCTDGLLEYVHYVGTCRLRQALRQGRGDADARHRSHLRSAVLWGPWLGWCAFMLQGYPNYTPATYPTNLSNIPSGTDYAVNCNNSQGIFGFHPGGANVAMGDGSVRHLSVSTSVKAMMYMATLATVGRNSGNDSDCTRDCSIVLLAIAATAGCGTAPPPCVLCKARCISMNRRPAVFMSSWLIRATRPGVQCVCTDKEGVFRLTLSSLATTR